jgi:hypothetical protein
MPEQYVQQRWEARKDIAKWSLRVMILVTLFLIGYACFWPGGIEVVERLATLIVTFFTAFTGIVSTYMGLDVIGTKNKNTPA